MLECLRNDDLIVKFISVSLCRLVHAFFHSFRIKIEENTYKALSSSKYVLQLSQELLMSCGNSSMSSESGQDSTAGSVIIGYRFIKFNYDFFFERKTNFNDEAFVYCQRKIVHKIQRQPSQIC